jgi:hypothetical protein
MQKVAWKSIKKDGGIGRASINHFTIDSKITLCQKDIPVQVHCLDAFGKKTCSTCLLRKDSVESRLKSSVDKCEYFKNTIDNLGGTYEFEDGVHKGWWDAYGDKTNLYMAYGRFTAMLGDNDKLWLIYNWVYYKPGEE